MAQLYYECNFELRNDNNSNAIKPYICTPEYCLYCCCDSHCCFVVQRRPSRHIWEIWYFWLGIALLAVFVISSVSSYVVNNYRHNIQGISFRHDNRQNERQFNNNQPRTDQNQVSISIIPSTGMFSSQKKMLIIGAQPNITHMSKTKKGETEKERWISVFYSALIYNMFTCCISLTSLSKKLD